MSYLVTNLTDKTLFANEYIFIPHDVNQVPSLTPEIMNLVDQGLFSVSPWIPDTKISKEDLRLTLDYKKTASILEMPLIEVGSTIEAKSSPGPSWLECDGSQYIRAHYPELSAIRSASGIDSIPQPLPTGSAFPATLGNPFWTGSKWLALKHSKDYYTRDFYSSIDGITWALHVNGLPNINMVMHSYMIKSTTTGRILMISPNNGRTCYSDDDGVTWTAATYLTFTDLWLVQPCVGIWSPITGFTVFKSGQARAATSPDGITWTYRDLLNYPTQFNHRHNITMVDYRPGWNGVMLIIEEGNEGSKSFQQWNIDDTTMDWDFAQNTYGGYESGLGVATGDSFGSLKPTKHPTLNRWFSGSVYTDRIKAKDYIDWDFDKIVCGLTSGKGFNFISGYSEGMLAKYIGSSEAAISATGDTWEIIKLDPIMATDEVGYPVTMLANGSIIIHRQNWESDPVNYGYSNSFLELRLNPLKFFVPKIKASHEGVKTYMYSGRNREA